MRKAGHEFKDEKIETKGRIVFAEDERVNKEISSIKRRHGGHLDVSDVIEALTSGDEVGLYFGPKDTC